MSSHGCYSALPVCFAFPHKTPEFPCLLSSYSIQASLHPPFKKRSAKLSRFEEFISWVHFVQLHKLVRVIRKAARMKCSNNSPPVCIQDSSAQMHKLCDSMAQMMQLAKLKLPEKCTETITQKNTAFPIVLFH